MKQFQKLYSRDSSQNIKEWRIFVTDGATITMEYGLLGGKIASSSNHIKEGKNIGKSNETTPYEQACSEAESKWTRMKKQGYKSLEDLYGSRIRAQEIAQLDDFDFKLQLNDTLPKDNTDNNGNIIPMKAQKYFKKNGNICIKFPCFAQDKINGVRCVAKLENGKVIFRSKKGLEYSIITHIADEFEDWMFDEDGMELIFDGELYIHNTILSDIKSAATKINLMTSTVEFRLFDIAIPNLTQIERFEIINNLKPHLEQCVSINIVNWVTINNDKEAQEFCDVAIKNGYEGAIFRSPNAEYQFGKRPSTMTKLKRRESEEFVIMDVIPMEKTPNLGMFVCRNDKNNHTFKVVPEGSHEIKTKYLKDKHELIGKELTVEFYERTKAPKEVPFHAVGITVRDYE